MTEENSPLDTAAPQNRWMSAFRRETELIGNPVIDAEKGLRRNNTVSTHIGWLMAAYSLLFIMLIDTGAM